MVARLAHNQQVGGSNPPSATKANDFAKRSLFYWGISGFDYCIRDLRALRKQFPIKLQIIIAKSVKTPMRMAA